MNWDRVEGQWKQRRGKAAHHWGKLMNDELAAIAGRHEELVGILQEKYGVASEEARKRVNEFKKIVGQLKASNIRLMRLQKTLLRIKARSTARVKTRSAKVKTVRFTKG